MYIFNLRGDELTDEWNIVYIINLYKKEDRKEWKNRDLSVTNSASRLYVLSVYFIAM